MSEIKLAWDFNTIAEHLEGIKQQVERFESRIEYLTKENQRLKSESYKDEELSRMKKELEQYKQDMYRGFPITEDEQKAIHEWYKKINPSGYAGAIGGDIRYEFIPTSIGVIGIAKCNDQSFTFQDLD